MSGDCCLLLLNNLKVLFLVLSSMITFFADMNILNILHQLYVLCKVNICTCTISSFVNILLYISYIFPLHPHLYLHISPLGPLQ